MSPETPLPSTPMMSDAPIGSPGEDLLGRANFAATLAKTISEMPAPDGFVFAVQGPWGHGKTSLLRLVEYYLKQHKDPEEPLRIVTFSPWLFSGTKQMLLAFFGQIANEYASSQEKAAKTLSGILEAYGGQLAQAANAIPSIWTRLVGGVLTVAVARLRQQADVHATRNKIRGLLSRQKGKLVVFIDDIDRLSSEEIRTIFRLVKAAADFPNIIYVLAFERQIVAEALRDVQGGSGQDYLEKIVQAPFDLPLPDPTGLRHLLDRVIADAMSSDVLEAADQTRYGNLYFLVSSLIRTPRDAKRYGNVLTFAWPAVRGEVDPVDFLRIEALRVFAPTIYDLVRNNREHFAGAESQLGSPRETPESRRPFYQAQVDELSPHRKDHILSMLRRLFPKVDYCYGGSMFGTDWEPGWRRSMRVCSPEVFDVYFRLSVPSGVLSAAEVQRIIDTTANKDSFESELLHLCHASEAPAPDRIRMFLERMMDYLEEFPSDHIEPTVRALLDAGDAIIALDRPRLSHLHNELAVARLIYQLRKRISSTKDQLDLLENAIQDSSSFWCPAYEVVLLEESASPDKPGLDEAEKALIRDRLPYFTALALAKINAAAADGRLRHFPRLALLLWAWREWERDQLREFIRSWTESDLGIAELLAALVIVGYSFALFDNVAVARPHIDRNFVDDIVPDPDQLRARAGAILQAPPEWLTEKHKLALEILLLPDEERP